MAAHQQAGDQQVDVEWPIDSRAADFQTFPGFTAAGLQMVHATAFCQLRYLLSLLPSSLALQLPSFCPVHLFPVAS